jgi:hypothetical protein
MSQNLTLALSLVRRGDQFLVDRINLDSFTPAILASNKPPSPYQGEDRGEVPAHVTTHYSTCPEYRQ